MIYSYHKAMSVGRSDSRSSAIVLDRSSASSSQLAKLGRVVRPAPEDAAARHIREIGDTLDPVVETYEQTELRPRFDGNDSVDHWRPDFSGGILLRGTSSLDSTEIGGVKTA